MPAIIVSSKILGAGGMEAVAVSLSEYILNGFAKRNSHVVWHVTKGLCVLPVKLWLPSLAISHGDGIGFKA